MIIETIFAFESTRVRQQAAPLFNEREQFLSHLAKQGMSKHRLRSCASMLLHVVRLMRLDTWRVLDTSEVEEAAKLWMREIESKNRNGQPKSGQLFTYVALKWLRFHRKLASASRTEPEDTQMELFVHFMTVIKGMSLLSIRSSKLRVAAFLRWNSSHDRPLLMVTLNHVDQYLKLKHDSGYLPRSTAGVCSALRLFFLFAESQGWTRSPIARGIYRPRVPRYDTAAKGPKWNDVRRLLDYDFGTKPAELRASAIISFCAIYALRSSEIVRLRLNDFDWYNEILTLKRAKTGRVQQFPIQFEVGEKLIRYLQKARPRCSCPHLFVTLKPPYRPVDPTAIWVIVASRMKSLQISSLNFGAHSLRHACATQLLHEGSSLMEIAEFLGHRDLKSVSVYAKHDIQALHEVASLALTEIL